MSITSFPFLVFLAGVFILYFLLPQKVKAPFLLVASLFFYYSWAKWAPVFMVLYSLYIYFAVKIINNQKKRRIYFFIAFIGIIIIVFLLFRYTDLPERFVNALISPLGISTSVIFPLGFSYYMFKSVSYLIDVYLGKLEPEKRYDYLLLHFCFFPEITMGPITRAIDFLPQIKAIKKLDTEAFYHGFILILWGFFKKLVLADRLAVTVNEIYNNMSTANGLTWIIISFAYYIQLYLEFSGYTDISVAVSGILGYKIKHNFRAPFFAQSISEFWRSWHISLCSWLSDYIFTPLQFAWRKCGVCASAFAALVTLVISGLWHEASMKYLIWGIVMGVLVAFDALFAKDRKALKRKLPKPVFVAIGITLTMLINVILVVFVRANDAHAACVIIYKYVLDMTTWSLSLGLKFIFVITMLVGIAATVFSHVIELNIQRFYDKFFTLPLVVRWICYYALLLSIIMFQLGGSDLERGFIYMQF